MNELSLIRISRQAGKEPFSGCIACKSHEPLIGWRETLNTESAPGCSPECCNAIASIICESLTELFVELLDVRWGTVSFFKQFTELNVVTNPEYDVFRVSRFRIDHTFDAPIARLLSWVDNTWNRIAFDSVTSDTDATRGEENWDFISSDLQGRTLITMIGKSSVEDLLASTVVTECSPNDLGRRLITRESLRCIASAVHPDHNPNADPAAIRQINEMMNAVRKGKRFHGVFSAFSYSRLGVAWLNPPMHSSGHQ